MDSEKTPFELGYSMPAEWEEHEATWISWPKNPDSFPEEIISEVENSYIRVIDALHKNEKVNLLVDDENYRKRVLDLLKSRNVGTENLKIHLIRTVDVWFRDYGPIFITRSNSGKKEIAFVHWIFNAWGGKYEDLKQDAMVPEEMPISDIRRFSPNIVLEGGSIDVNGLGTCLTTEQCLLNRNRNPELGKKEIEAYLRDYIGATKVIWLKSGIEGDDTDGHVDDIARFVNTDTIVCALEENGSDDNYAALMQNFELLKAAKDQDGKRLNIVTLPMPKPIFFNGMRLPASYLNFYIANKSVLVPIFGDENDNKALYTLKKLFPDRDVVGINCRALVYGFGAIHCTTQQQPRI